MKSISTTHLAFLLVLAAPTWAVEHPGVLPNNAECPSCHTKQISGKTGALGNGDFVHSVSCCEGPGRHDHAEPGDGEGTDLLFLP